MNGANQYVGMPGMNFQAQNYPNINMQRNQQFQNQNQMMNQNFGMPQSQQQGFPNCGGNNFNYGGQQPAPYGQQGGMAPQGMMNLQKLQQNIMAPRNNQNQQCPGVKQVNPRDHKPTYKIPAIFEQVKLGGGIDQNEYVTIKKSAEEAYNKEKPPLSDAIAKKIKDQLKGDWLVFVSEKGKSLDFHISTVADDDFIAFNIGDTYFQVIRLGN